MQFSIWLWASLLSVLSGLAFHFYLKKTKADYQVDWWEFGAGLFLTMALVVPATIFIGAKMAFNDNVTYHQNLQGWETQAEWLTTPCDRDGACEHTYDCDPYEESYECGGTEGTGKDAHYVSKTCYRTEYHHCPYCTEEWRFVVNSTLGSWTIASNQLPSTKSRPDPNDWRWRSDESVPTDEFSGEIGIPSFWAQVKDRIDRNDPGPVTKRGDYVNYILASRVTALKRYSAELADFQKQGLLPKLGHDVQEPYYLNRVYTAGVAVSDLGRWQWEAQQFDAALGSTLQGDLDIVIVPADKIASPDDYVLAIAAYWQSQAFGKDSLSKNGIVVVLGTSDGKTISWARATTGMPSGNEAMLDDIQAQLRGQKLDPEVVLGHPTYSISTRTVNHSTGILDTICWGPHKFERVHMSKDGGYSYLKYDVQLTDAQQGWILFFAFLASLCIWGICIVSDLPATVLVYIKTTHRNLRSR